MGPHTPPTQVLMVLRVVPGAPGTVWDRMVQVPRTVEVCTRMRKMMVSRARKTRRTRTATTTRTAVDISAETRRRMTTRMTTVLTAETYATMGVGVATVGIHSLPTTP